MIAYCFFAVLAYRSNRSLGSGCIISISKRVSNDVISSHVTACKKLDSKLDNLLPAIELFLMPVERQWHNETLMLVICARQLLLTSSTNLRYIQHNSRN